MACSLSASEVAGGLHPVKRLVVSDGLEHTQFFKPGASNEHCGLVGLLCAFGRKFGAHKGMIGWHGADHLSAANDRQWVILGNRRLGGTEISKHSIFDIWYTVMLANNNRFGVADRTSRNDDLCRGCCVEHDRKRILLDDSSLHKTEVGKTDICDTFHDEDRRAY